MKSSLERGLLAVNESVLEFMAGHAGRLEVYTYGPEGGEPRIVSYDIGVHEIDGADATEWVTDGATIVMSLKRRRRADAALGASTSAGSGPESVGITAQVLPQAIETQLATNPVARPAAHQATGDVRGAAASPGTEPAMDARPAKKSPGPSVPHKSVKGVVPHMPPAPGVER